jgi:hypothetical protein
MKKQLRLLSLIIALFAFIQSQTVEAQNSNVLYLPGTSGASSMTVPILSSKITSYPFTIEMWIKPSAITAYGGLFYDKSGTKTCLQFANATTGEMRFDLFGGATVVPLTSAKKIEVGKWQHVAVTVYSDSAVVEIDGNFYSSTHTKVFSNFCTVAPTIGLDKDVAARTFSGLIDEVRIWKSGRTRSEITNNKNVVLNPASFPDLVAYYNFDKLTANDATANALNPTLSSSAFVTNLIWEPRLSTVNASGGFLTPTFNSDSLNYSIYAPQGVTLTGVAIGDGVTITNNPATPTVANPNVTLVSKAMYGQTKIYTFKTTFMPFSAWDADGKTGAGSEPNYWGWICNNSTSAWGQVNGSANRYNEVTNTSWFYNDGTNQTVWKGRDLYVRWDGTGGTTQASVFSYPMYLEACKAYEFSTKYCWVNNSSSPTLTLAIGTDISGTSTLISASVPCSTTRQIFFSKSLKFTPPTTGVYYFTVKGSTAALCALADMNLVEVTTPQITTNPASLSFSDVNKSVQFTVNGNKLTNAISISAPAGITLSKTSIPASESSCGSIVTATYNYSKAISSGNIILTSGTVNDTVPFTYTKPTVSVYEQDAEVENIGKYYPLLVSSVNNSVDSLYITASTGLTLEKSSFSLSDFVNSSINVKVSSTAVAGTKGTLMFSNKLNGTSGWIDTVNVTSVAAYKRYNIKHKASGFVIGNNSAASPVLTENKGINTQNFIIRRTNSTSLTDTSYYILQDSSYRALRKMPSSAWSTEYGAISNEAKWTIQKKGNDIITLTNVVTGKVLGTDAATVNSAMYDDKTWAAAGNAEWTLVETLSKTHSYTFDDGTAKDVINGDNGVVSGTNAKFINGAFVSNGDYITLPASKLALSNYSAITLEGLITSGNAENSGFTMLAYFGGLSGANCFWIQPTRGGSNVASQAEATGIALNGIEMDEGLTHHVVSVLTKDTLFYYIDGALVGKKATAADKISIISNANAWLCKGGWSDPMWRGKIHEFNIYNGAMSASMVKDHAYASLPNKDICLEALSIDYYKLSPSTFSPTVKRYGALIPAGTAKMNVNAVPHAAGSTIIGAGIVDVSKPAGIDTIWVTSYDKSVTGYYLLSYSHETPLILKHSYTFEDGTAKDVTGKADGTLVGGTIAKGAYTTTANGQYINLPGDAIAINTYPSITTEMFIKAANNGNGLDVMAAYFGNTIGSYGTDYFFMSHKSRAAMSCLMPEGPWAVESGVTGSKELDDAGYYHLVSTVTNDSIGWYVNGEKIGKVALSTDNKIFNLSNKYAYLCKSGYTGDATWIGTILEFNIYSGIMSDAMISAKSKQFLATGVEKVSEGEISVISLDGSFLIQTPFENGSVNVYNLAGKCIYKGTINANKETIPVNVSGLYFIEIMNGADKTVLKAAMK